jgi:hypothetical protein
MDRKGTFEPQLVRKGQRRFWRGRFGRWGLAGLRSLVMRHNHDATAPLPRGRRVPTLSTAITRTNALAANAARRLLRRPPCVVCLS